ncbi:hypothetical protein BpHYR1_004293, partial [Brachionus plicatilis]
VHTDLYSFTLKSSTPCFLELNFIGLYLLLVTCDIVLVRASRPYVNLDKQYVLYINDLNLGEEEGLFLGRRYEIPKKLL